METLHFKHTPRNALIHNLFIHVAYLFSECILAIFSVLESELVYLARLQIKEIFEVFE